VEFDVPRNIGTDEQTASEKLESNRVVLSADPDEENEPSRSRVADRLRFGLGRFPPGSRVQKEMVRQAREREIEWSLSWAFYQLDSPVAVRFCVESQSTVNLLDYFRRWQPETFHGSRLSEDSQEELCRIWEDETTPDELRYRAFKAWVGSQEGASLSRLRRITDEQTYSDAALRKRVELGDTSAVEALVDRIVSLITVFEGNVCTKNEGHRVPRLS